ncbi:MAG: hypothetical protein ABI548_03800 [Polyangiaceae bacterium]
MDPGDIIFGRSGGGPHLFVCNDPLNADNIVVVAVGLGEISGEAGDAQIVSRAEFRCTYQGDAASKAQAAVLDAGGAAAFACVR